MTAIGLGSFLVVAGIGIVFLSRRSPKLIVEIAGGWLLLLGLALIGFGLSRTVLTVMVGV